MSAETTSHPPPDKEGEPREGMQIAQRHTATGVELKVEHFLRPFGYLSCAGCWHMEVANIQHMINLLSGGPGWAAQSVGCLVPDLRLGHDRRIMRSSPEWGSMLSTKSA